MKELLDRLRDTRCDRAPFTPDHAECVCRLTNEAANEIERLRVQFGELRAAFRVNMLRHCAPSDGASVDAEIDRVLATIESTVKAA